MFLIIYMIPLSELNLCIQNFAIRYRERSHESPARRSTNRLIAGIPKSEFPMIHFIRVAVLGYDNTRARCEFLKLSTGAGNFERMP